MCKTIASNHLQLQAGPVFWIQMSKLFSGCSSISVFWFSSSSSAVAPFAHIAVKQVSPAPNFSPSSIVCGIALSKVSGRKVTKNPEIRAITANIIAGIFGSKESRSVIKGVRAPDVLAHIAPRPANGNHSVKNLVL
ncbi:unnamed protein product [Acanthoscelides obtectus]|uniref:Uncharacterized protein n=1 Tax=Acanthoscelides obtectus TaxID=200917 RepID=A0A9P0LTE3_ACAOB|nr:unnamed protein product [Acanthoscelides obtectus]CAK1667828.1 hypothetical protein AOBTE_LOCUS26051 [Acanthoscelides obtectus]